MQLFKYIVILSSFNFLFRYCLENDKFSILVYNHYKETRHQWNGLTKMKPKFSDSDSNDKLWLVRLIFVIDIFFSWIKLHLWWSLHITSVPGLLEGELLVAGIAVIICSSSFGPREGVWQISELLGWSSWHLGCVFRVHSDAQIIVGDADVYAGIQSVDGTGREGSTNGAHFDGRHNFLYSFFWSCKNDLQCMPLGQDLETCSRRSWAVFNVQAGRRLQRRLWQTFPKIFMPLM